MRLRVFVFLLVCGSCLAAFAQKTKVVEGEYTFYVPPTMSLVQAESEALKRAQIEALANEYGTIIQQSSMTMTLDRGEEFYQEGVGLVKGEWIETIDAPYFERGFHNNEMFVKCRVKGRAREIKSDRAELEIHILRNEPDDRSETSEFHNGDNIYLHFESPVDGYLAVFLYDSKNDVVNCLLPYRRDKVSVVKVESDRPYFFFSKEKSVQGLRTEEYSMGANDELETNVVYIVFSKNEFVKPTLSFEGGRTVLKQITFEKFNQWLNKLLAQDADAQVEKRMVSIYRD